MAQEHSGSAWIVTFTHILEKEKQKRPKRDEEKDLGALWAHFCDLLGSFFSSLESLVADIGCLWTPFGPALAAIGWPWGASWAL